VDPISTSLRSRRKGRTRAFAVTHFLSRKISTDSSKTGKRPVDKFLPDQYYSTTINPCVVFSCRVALVSLPHQQSLKEVACAKLVNVVLSDVRSVDQAH
jgi:hypothetical protein